jgi:Tol biopolymer transport system component
VPPGKAFFLDLRTGEKRALADSLAGGHNYVASPDGTRLAYSSGQGGGCEAPGMTVANIDGTNARTLEPPKGLIMCAPRWSPDGTKLVYQVRDGASGSDVGNLFIEDLSSGRRTQLTNLKLTKAWWWFRSPSFSPDGRNVIYHLPRSSAQTTKWDVWSVPVTGGEPTLVIRNATFPMYFPDGKEVAFLSPFASDFAGQSLSIAGAQGSRRTLAEPTGAGASIWWPTMSPDGARIAYQDGGSIYVVDVSTGHSSKVADGSTAEWLDNNTLIVAVGID